MKVLLLALFVVAAAAPTPLEVVKVDLVEVTVNCGTEGEPLDMRNITHGLNLKEHVDGELVASNNLLYPHTTQELIEATINNLGDFPNSLVLQKLDAPVIPESIIVSNIFTSEVEPAPVVLPKPVIPEVVRASKILPFEAEVSPKTMVIPEIVSENVISKILEVAEELPLPVPQEMPNEEIFNNGKVQVTLDFPEEQGIIATLQSWFNQALNYISNGVQATQQII